MIVYREYPGLAGVEIVLPETVTRSEFEVLGQRLADFSAEYGAISLCLDAQGDGGKRAVVFWSDVKSLLENLHPQSRCAIVAPERWRVWLVTSGKAMAPCELRLYSEGDGARARGWLLGGAMSRPNKMPAGKSEETAA